MRTTLPLALILLASSTLTAAPSELPPLGGQDGVSYAVALSPDSKRMASGGKDGTVILWDVEGRYELLRLTEHTGPILCLAFSPSGDFVVSGSADRTVRFWDVQTGKEKREVIKAHDEAVTAVAINRDASLIATAGWDGKVKLWDNKGEAAGQHELHKGPVFSLAFAPNGELLASGGRDQTVHICNIKDKKEAGSLKDNKRTVWALAFLPDSKTLAIGAGKVVADNVVIIPVIRLREVGAKTEKASWPGHSAAIRSLSIGNDGKSIASASDDGTVRIWSLDGKGQPQVIETGAGIVSSVALSGDGKTVVAATADPVRSVRMWTVK